jgi:hypothetical protein
MMKVKRLLIAILLAFALVPISSLEITIDGEDAGSTPWEFTALLEEAGNTFALDADAKSHGSYGYKASLGGINDQAMGYITFANQSELYVRAYFKVSAGFSFGTAWHQTRIISLYDDEWVGLVNFRIQADAGLVAYRWQITGENLATGTDETTFSLNEWHCLELYWVKHASIGGAKVWVDGVEIYSDLDNNTSARDCDRLYAGSGGDLPDAGGYVYFDDIKIDSTGRIYGYDNIVEYYVDASRDSNGDGSEADPWKAWSDVTWATVTTTLQTDDATLYFSSQDTWTSTGTFEVGSTGTAVHPLIIDGDSKYNLTDSGTASWQAESAGNRATVQSSGGNGGDLKIAAGKSYITLQGFKVYHPTWGGINLGTANPTENLHHITVDNCFIDTPTHNHGIWFGYA